MSGHSFPSPTGAASPTALRRLQRDLQKLLEEPISGIIAMPTEENILEWHYVLRGSPDTSYYGGYYHGKLVFQPDFPWKPPAICMTTPNGRFRTNMRLCLSISDYHPESWNPGWTVASILVGLHSFMNEESYAAGVSNESAHQRRKYAEDSIRYNLENPQFTRMFPDLCAELRGDKPATTVGGQSSGGSSPVPLSPVPSARTGRKRDLLPEDADQPPNKKEVDVVDLTDD